MIRQEPEQGDRCRPGDSQPGNGFPPEGAGGLIQLLGGLLVFFGLSQVLTVLSSLGGLSLTPGVAIAILTASALAGLLYGRGLGIGSGEKARRPRRGGDRLIRAILGLAVAWYLFLWCRAYLLPDTSWDGLWYHNPTIHFWALKGRVHWITADHCSYWTPIIDNFWNGYPKAAELFGFLMIRASGLFRLLNAINLPWFPLGVLGVALLSRAAGARLRFALLAGALFLFIPVSVTQSPTTYVDAAAASCYIACLAMTIVAAGRIDRGVFPWKLLSALGCGLGLALGVKGTGGAVLVIGMVVIVLGLLMARGGKNGSSPVPHKSRYPAVFLLIPVAIALAVGGYWYVRNWIIAGSPLHPVGVAVAGFRVFPGELDPGSLVTPAYASGTEEWNQLQRILHAWGQGWSAVNWQEAVRSYTSRRGGLGYLWLLGCLPAVGWTLAGAVSRRIRRSPFRREADVAIIRLAVMVLALFLIIPRNHIARFSIWVYGLGLPALAVAAGRVAETRVSVLRAMGIAWVAASAAVAILEGAYAAGGQQGCGLLAGGPGGRSPAGYAWPRIRGTALEEIIAGQDPVALSEVGEAGGKNRILGHLTQGPALGRRPIYFLDRETVGNSPERLREFIESRGLRYLIWDADIPIPRPLARRIDDWHRVDGLFYLLEFFPEDR